MYLVAIATHALILAVPWLIAREPGAAVAIGVWVVTTSGGARPVGEVPPAEARRALALLATLALALVFAGPVAPMPAALGVMLLLGGTALRRWSMGSLAGAFTATIRTHHPRVTHGPYRWLDHPSEVGLCSAALGFVTLCGTPIGLVAWLLLVVLPSRARCIAEDRAWTPAARPGRRP